MSDGHQSIFVSLHGILRLTDVKCNYRPLEWPSPLTIGLRHRWTCLVPTVWESEYEFGEEFILFLFFYVNLFYTTRTWPVVSSAHLLVTMRTQQFHCVFALQDAPAWCRSCQCQRSFSTRETTSSTAACLVLPTILNSSPRNGNLTWTSWTNNSFFVARHIRRYTAHPGGMS